MALLGLLHPYPMAWRDELTNRLQARGIQISRAFLALCNLNLLEYASIVDRNHIQTAFHDSTGSQITALSQSLNLALRECRLRTRPVRVNTCGQYDSSCIWMIQLTFIALTIGGRIGTSAVASAAGAPTPPIVSGRSTAPPLAPNPTARASAETQRVSSYAIPPPFIPG